jgi:hypothetical protein
MRQGLQVGSEVVDHSEADPSLTLNTWTSITGGMTRESDTTHCTWVDLTSSNRVTTTTVLHPTIEEAGVATLVTTGQTTTTSVQTVATTVFTTTVEAGEGCRADVTCCETAVCNYDKFA